MKKGIAPLISWILIVAMVIATGAFVFYWTTNYIKKINPQEGINEDLYCNSVNLKILSSCRRDDHNMLYLNIFNKGSYSLEKLTFFRDTEKNPAASCIQFLPAFLEPGKNFELEFNINDTINTDSLQECPTVNLNKNPEIPYAEEVAITPWINIEGKSIACNDRKVKVDNYLLNTPCVSLTISPDFAPAYSNLCRPTNFPLTIQFTVTNNGEAPIDIAPTYYVDGTNGNQGVTLDHLSAHLSEKDETTQTDEATFTLTIIDIDPNGIPNCCTISLSVPGNTIESNQFVVNQC
ncbi:MAG: hypothetical protein AABW41_02425 [Nanoarchaeota archaeon]